MHNLSVLAMAAMRAAAWLTVAWLFVLIVGELVLGVTASWRKAKAGADAFENAIKKRDEAIAELMAQRDRLLDQL